MLMLMTAFSATAPAHAVDAVKNASPQPYSEFQFGFMKIVYDYSVKYRAAENQLQKSALVTERFKQFEKLKGNPRQIKDWLGILEGMGTTGEGKAFVIIRVSPETLTFSTWNNGFSDINDKSLISQSSPVYAKLASMKKGNVVKFSGKLKRATNMTEEGRMTSPDFLFIFSDIEKVAESVRPI